MNAKTRNIMRGRFHALFAELCQQFDLPKTSEQRHQVAQWILGYDKSSSQWTGKEYSLVIDQMRDWIRGDVEPHALDQNTRNHRDFDQTRKQLIYAIEHLGAPEAYIQHIAESKFNKRPWREQGTLQLQRLRYTINARMQAKKKATT